MTMKCVSVLHTPLVLILLMSLAPSSHLPLSLLPAPGHSSSHPAPLVLLQLL